MTTRTLLLASAGIAMLLAAPDPAAAQPVTGLYIAGAGGVNLRQNQDFRSPVVTIDDDSGGGGESAAAALAGPGVGLGGSVRGHLGHNAGFAALGSIGWGYGNGLRAEIEGSYRNNAVRRLTGAGLSLPVTGTAHTYAVMANVLFDMDIGQNWVYPYIGGGVGYAWTNLHDVRFPGAFSVGGTSGNFAYQAIAGAALPIAPVVGLSLTLEYRFLGTLGGDYGLRVPLPRGGVASVGGFHTSGQHNHAGLVGLRYAFSVAPPAPAPAAAAPAAAMRSFMVFFDWDRAVLTDRARQVIQEAAATSRQVQHTRIEVNGYADTSGTPRYNMDLSMRRAQNVAAELVRNGVARGEIAIKAFGDTVLLVPTGPGVREPQNRRVEIIIR